MEQSKGLATEVQLDTNNNNKGMLLDIPVKSGSGDHNLTTSNLLVIFRESVFVNSNRLLARGEASRLRVCVAKLLRKRVLFEP